MSKNKYDQQHGSSDDDVDFKAAGGHKDQDQDDDKSSNTIMQQINNFTLIPMNQNMANQTIEDHKYLLELVENKAAIAYFSAANRN